MSESAQEEVVKDEQKAGGAPEEKPQPKEEVKKQDPASGYRKDMLKFKDENESLRKKIEDMELAKLQESNQHKEVAEHYKTKAEAAEAEVQKIRDSLVYDRKYAALREAAAAAGMRKEALGDLDLIDMDQLVIETTNTGRINVLGASELIEQQKTQRPHWFGRKSANINGADPEISPDSGGKVTKEQIFKAEKEAVKTGDYAPYQTLLNKYRQQNSL